jgi:hypothetical protein
MSFDIYLLRFKDGKPVETDRAPILEVLKTYSYRSPDKYSFYDVAFPGGGSVEFSASGLESEEPFNGCAFFIRGLSDGLMKFMFDVARAGELVIFPVMKDSPCILVSQSQAKEVPPDVSKNFKLIVVTSAEELGSLLKGGFAGWSAYRDHVLRQGNANNKT